MSRFSISIILILIAGNLMSATFTTTGTSTNWADNSAWDQGAPPGALDDVVILHTLTLNASATVASVTLNGAAADLTFVSSLVFNSGHFHVNAGRFDAGDNSTVTVTGNLYSTNGGTIEIGNSTVVNVSQDITSPGDSVIIGTSSTVNVSGDVVFSGNGVDLELGSGSLIDITGNLSISGNASVQNISGDISADNFTAFGAGIHNFNILTGGSVAIADNVDISGGVVYNIASGALMSVGDDMKVDGGIANGVVDGTLSVTDTLNLVTTVNDIVGTGSAPAYTYVGLGSVFGTEANTLPVELVYFKAVASENGVNFSWQTASEENNDFFTIERSFNGVDFESIAKISGAGNSSLTLDYNYSDKKVLYGNYYYRLKQTDYDGQFSYSNAVSVSFNISAISDINIWNVNEDLCVDLQRVHSEVGLSVFTLSGIKIFEKRYIQASSICESIDNISGIVQVVVELEGGIKVVKKVYIP